MKKIRLPSKAVLVCIIFLIPLYKQVLRTDSDWWIKILSPAFMLFATYLGSGTISLVLSFVMHYLVQLMIWIFGAEHEKILKDLDNFDDVTIFFYGSFPIIFGVAYYCMLIDIIKF